MELAINDMSIYLHHHLGSGGARAMAKGREAFQSPQDSARGLWQKGARMQFVHAAREQHVGTSAPSSAASVRLLALPSLSKEHKAASRRSAVLRHAERIEPCSGRTYFPSLTTVKCFVSFHCAARARRGARGKS